MMLSQLLTHHRNRRAGVTVLAATLFPVLIGMAGLATAYGDALLTNPAYSRAYLGFAGGCGVIA